MNHKQKLEDVAVELAFAKEHLKEAQLKFDKLYNQLLGQGRVRSTKPSKTTKEPEEHQTNRQLPPAETPAINGSTQSQRIEELLRSAPTRLWSYDEIAEATNVPKPSIRPLIFKLAKAGKARRVRRGRWKAVLPEKEGNA